MPKKPTSKQALAQVGKLESPLTERNPKGQFDTSRAQMGRAHALDILNDPQYRENLKKRMVAGEGGAIEVWIWRIGYGEPQKDEGEAEAQRARFEAARAEVRAFLLKNPAQAHVLDAAVQGATRLLPRPQLVRVVPDEPA